MKTTMRGGPRPNSGRKPIKDKKEQVVIYLRLSEIKKLGGPDKTKKVLTTLIVEYINSL